MLDFSNEEVPALRVLQRRCRHRVTRDVRDALVVHVQRRRAGLREAHVLEDRTQVHDVTSRCRRRNDFRLR